MEGLVLQKCKMCSKPLPLGSLKYVVSVKVFADFDEVMEEDEAPIAEGELQKLIDHVGDTDPWKLEEDVYMERVFVLCSRCKRRYSESLFGGGTDKGAMESPVH